MATYYTDCIGGTDVPGKTPNPLRYQVVSDALDKYASQFEAANRLAAKMKATPGKKQCEGCGSRKHELKLGSLRCSYCGGIW